jgi:glycosyltransferase involved in cell wall biosynthesis
MKRDRNRNISPDNRFSNPNSSPTVSLGLPVYNGQQFLRDALDSVLAQTFDDFELIILDNASTDNTEIICREYAARDRRIRYYRRDRNIGAARNFNQCVHLANGRYFKWVAHDDICAPTFLQECTDVLDRDESIVLCYPLTQPIDAEGKPIRFGCRRPQQIDDSQPHRRFRDVLLNGVWNFEVFGLMRTDALRQTDLIGKYFASDKVLLAELSLRGRFFEIPKPLFYRRFSPRQATNLTVCEKAVWIDPLATIRLPAPAYSIVAYATAIWKVPLTLSQRLYCYRSLLQLALKSEKWHKLLLPGRYNYFGISHNPLKGIFRFKFQRNSRRRPTIAESDERRPLTRHT